MILYRKSRFQAWYNEQISEIQSTIESMNLNYIAKKRLTDYSIKLFNRMESEKVLTSKGVQSRAFVSIFLACDQKACITIPKLRRVHGSKMPIKYIAEARTKLDISRPSIHEKVDSLCIALTVSNKHLINAAHEYAEYLITQYSDCAPTHIAALSVYSAGYRDVDEITAKTGLTRSSLLYSNLSKHV